MRSIDPLNALRRRLVVLMRTRVVGVVLIGALAGLWQLSVVDGWVRSDNWPRITDIAKALALGLTHGELWTVLAATLSRTLIGFAIGSSVGVVLGLLLGRSRFADYLLRPLIEIERTLPAPAIVPPLILLLGVEQALKIVVISLAAFAPVFVNTYAGVRAIDETILLTGKTFGLNRLSTIVKVVLPSAVPSIAAGMRVALSLSLVNAVIAEMISGSSGIGYYLMTMQYAMRAADMYAAIVCLALAGYLFNRIFLMIERRVLHWYARAEVLEWI